TLDPWPAVAEEQHRPRGVFREVVKGELEIVCFGGCGLTGQPRHRATSARLPSSRGLTRRFNGHIGVRAEELKLGGAARHCKLLAHAGADRWRWPRERDELFPLIVGGPCLPRRKIGGHERCTGDQIPSRWIGTAGLDDAWITSLAGK